MQVLLSGLLAAIISGLVSFYGTKRSIETQKEIAKMQQNEKIFYESQLQWSNQLRSLIAKFVRGCFRLNIITEKITDTGKKVSKKQYDPDEKGKILKEISDNLNEAARLLEQLQEQVTLIRLLLFHLDNEEEKKILLTLSQIENSMKGTAPIDLKLLNHFVDIVRSYFNKQMQDFEQHLK